MRTENLLLVGIPTHKRPQLLRKCLDSIAAQTGALPSICVFVADNDAAGREGVRVVEEMAADYPYPISSAVVADPGISAVRNVILAEARRAGADFIAMIDDDETASEQWLAELLRAQSDYGVDVVAGPTIREVPSGAPGWLRDHEAFNSNPGATTGPVDCVNSTSNVLLACAALDRANWPQFDLGYGLSGGGDKEYFLRLKSMGFTFAWKGEAETYEPLPTARVKTSWFIQRQFRYGNNAHRLRRAYGPDVALGPAWAVYNLLASPALAILSLHPRFRMKALRRMAYSAGMLAARFGYTYQEYSDRHGGKPQQPTLAPVHSPSQPGGRQS